MERKIGVTAYRLALGVGLGLAVAAGPAAGEGFFDRLRGGGDGGGNRGGGGGQSACLAPESAGDADVRRAAAAIRAAGLCVTETTVNGAMPWRFFTVAHPRARRGPVWYLPHDNEDTAFRAALHAVVRYGGSMVALETGEQRNYRGIDPNRYFALNRGDIRACSMSAPAPAYTRHVMSLFRGRDAILTLHNNTRGGGVSVNMSGPKVTGFRASGPLSDPDHLVFIAGKRAVDNDRAARKRRDGLLSVGLNVVHERVSERTSDCSLSNHVALNDGRPYYNVEAVHGSRIQHVMVDRLMQVLRVRPLR